MNTSPISLLTNRGWYSRGYLPHRDHPGILQSITYRLADSLPQSVLRAIEAHLNCLPADRQDRAKREMIDRSLDKSYGSCILRNPEVARGVVDAWRYSGGERYDLIAWVVMPNHVHVLVRVYKGVELAKVVQSWKSYTGRQIARLAEGQGGRAGTRRSQAIWMRDYWDRYIRDERHFDAVVSYIHRNPVKAGLCSRPEGWPWSSSRQWRVASVS